MEGEMPKELSREIDMEESMKELKGTVNKFESGEDKIKSRENKIKLEKMQRKRLQNFKKDHEGVMKLLSTKTCFLCPEKIQGYYFNELENTGKICEVFAYCINCMDRARVVFDNNLLKKHENELLEDV